MSASRGWNGDMKGIEKELSERTAAELRARDTALESLVAYLSSRRGECLQQWPQKLAAPIGPWEGEVGSTLDQDAIRRRAAEIGERRLQLCVAEAVAADRAEMRDLSQEEFHQRFHELQVEEATATAAAAADQAAAAELERRLARTRQEVVGEQRVAEDLKRHALLETAALSRVTVSIQQEEAAQRTKMEGLKVELASGAQGLRHARATKEAAVSVQLATRRAVEVRASEDASRVAQQRRELRYREEATARAEAETAALRGTLASARSEAEELQARLDRREQRLRSLERGRRKLDAQAHEIQLCEARLSALEASEALALQPATASAMPTAPGHTVSAIVAELDVALQELGYDDSLGTLPGLRGETELLVRASAFEKSVRALDGELREFIGGHLRPEEECRGRQVRELYGAFGIAPPV